MKATLANPYPQTFEQFLDWFSVEEDCTAYLEWIRWPDGFICVRRRLGRFFVDSRKPLRLWFHVMWLMMAQKTGLSAKNLCDTYGFGSYQTAWAGCRSFEAS